VRVENVRNNKATLRIPEAALIQFYPVYRTVLILLARRPVIAHIILSLLLEIKNLSPYLQHSENEECVIYGTYGEMPTGLWVGILVERDSLEDRCRWHINIKISV